MKRTLYTSEHEAFRSSFRSFLDREAAPHIDQWEAAGTPDRTFITSAAANGYLGFEFDPAVGGLGIEDFRYNAVMTEEVVASGMAGDTFTMQNDIIVPYLRELATAEQQERWLPRFTAGDLVTALGMTEPGAGSDLAAIRTSGVRDGDELVINGSKTFITSGATCDLAIVLVRTGERDGRGTTFVAVEAGTPGFDRGRPMRKIGRKAQDTAELFFQDCRVPLSNIIGDPGRGFGHAVVNLPRERLSLAVAGVASAAHALSLTLTHVKERVAFGAPLAALQSIRMNVAEMHTDIQIIQSYIDRCITELNSGTLSADDAAGAKYKATDLQWDVLDRCLQLFGGYGYMEEYPIARMWRDARIQRIYGGANEVMKDLVGRAVVA
ncbi:acyl-CoA dehydrogenase family protein [Arthrobacter sp. 08Y14]|uniref:acyl-CoA dehydrogenase family protein n=1 Tax=Arthrobacter sp. 08Y14 TaxID=2058885 RepID=UPI000CE3EDC1|nr:acyl-CoA dehydrogenase family protein [Arthrobacter sp. 08Y14]